MPSYPEQLQTFKVLAHSPYTIQCVSCNHRHVVDGSNCTYAGAMFSKDARFYALSCAGPGVPEVTIFDKVCLSSAVCVCKVVVDLHLVMENEPIS